MSHALIIARRPVSLIRSACFDTANKMEREDLQVAQERDDQMAPLSTAYMQAMQCTMAARMDEQRRRASRPNQAHQCMLHRPMGGKEERQAGRPEHNLLNVHLRSSITLFPIEALHCSSASHYTLNLACRFQVTVQHCNAFHYHAVHSTCPAAKLHTLVATEG